MNLFICTARIITTPRLSLDKQKPLTQMIVCMHNHKKRYLSYYVYTKVKGKLAHKVFEMYNTGDFIVVQGSIKMKVRKIQYSNKNTKTKKYIIINVHKIYPAKS